MKRRTFLLGTMAAAAGPAPIARANEAWPARPVTIVVPFGAGGIVDSVAEAANVLPQVLALDRRAVRRRFEQRFCSTRTATEYLEVYPSRAFARGNTRQLGNIPRGFGNAKKWTAAS
jgi:hypothetical protein